MMTNDIAVQQITPPAHHRLPSRLGRIDYEDVFTVAVGGLPDRDAEQWMRAILQDAPATVRARLRWAWTAIGLRLGPTDSPRTVLGWPVHARDSDALLLGADSRIGMPGELSLQREGSVLSFSTRVRHDNPIARAVWSAIVDSHVRTVRSLLESARRRATG
jgi:hypothetical protein